MPAAPIKPPPSIDRLRQLFSFDPTSGLFTRIVGLRGRGASSGKVAGSKTHHGYIELGIDRRRYRAHRLAWLMVYGTFPREIDHINRNRADNRIMNLRPASRALNALNSSLHADSRSGVAGVYNDGPRYRNPWAARVKVDQKIVHLGHFKTKELAIAARNAAFQVEITKRLIKVAEEYSNAA